MCLFWFSRPRALREDPILPSAKFNSSPLKRYRNPNRKGLLKQPQLFHGENSLLNSRGVVHHHSSNDLEGKIQVVSQHHSKIKRNLQFSNLQYPYDISLD